MAVAYADGGCRNNGNQWVSTGYGSYRIVTAGGLIDESRVSLPKAKTSNEAEYGILLKLLQDERLESDSIIYTDSQLLVGQLQLGWKVKANNLKPLAAQAAELLAAKRCKLEWVSREAIEARLGH
mgnify:CR=1 FL=1